MYMENHLFIEPRTNSVGFCKSIILHNNRLFYQCYAIFCNIRDKEKMHLDKPVEIRIMSKTDLDEDSFEFLSDWPGSIVEIPR